jgi:hypothetical protein
MALERIAAELDVAAVELGPGARALSIAATRARAALPERPTTAAARPAAAPKATRPAEPAPSPETTVYASWGRRIVAFLIDWIVIGAIASWIPGSYRVSDTASIALWFFIFPCVYFAPCTPCSVAPSGSACSGWRYATRTETASTR